MGSMAGSCGSFLDVAWGVRRGYRDPRRFQLEHFEEVPYLPTP